jgi:hypothetical protein
VFGVVTRASTSRPDPCHPGTPHRPTHRSPAVSRQALRTPTLGIRVTPAGSATIGVMQLPIPICRVGPETAHGRGASAAAACRRGRTGGVHGGACSAADEDAPPSAAMTDVVRRHRKAVAGVSRGSEGLSGRRSARTAAATPAWSAREPKPRRRHGPRPAALRCRPLPSAGKPKLNCSARTHSLHGGASP